MQVPGTEIGNMGAVAERIGALARLRGELARRKAQKKMVGGGVAVVGVMVLRLALLAGLAAAVAGIATALDTWLAILVVFGALLVLGVGLLGAGAGILKGDKPQKAQNRAEPQALAAGPGKPRTRDRRTDAEIRNALVAEREAIVETIRRQAPMLAVGAFAVGFVVSGGIGATVRPLLRRR